MSLVIAAHNNNEIVIAFDSLSVSTKTGSRQQDSAVEKVKQINPMLAYIMTGSFMSDKLQFIRDYASSAQSTTELDTAFWSLHDMATRFMVVHPSDGFRIGLAGFNAGVPGFKCITVEYGCEIVLHGASRNYYVSGEAEPVILSEKRLKENLISRKPPTDEITDMLSSIVKECIDTYPATLGDPVSTLVLSRPKRVKVKNGRHKK